MYGKQKSLVYGILYGGDPEQIAKHIGITEEEKERALDELVARYPEVGRRIAQIQVR